MFGRPDAVLFQRHELDEAHDHAFFAREHAEGNDLIFVESAQQHAIHFHRPQARTPRRADARQHVVKSIGNARDAGKAVGIHSVHADGDPGQAGILERLRHLRPADGRWWSAPDVRVRLHGGRAAWPIRGRNSITPLRSSGSPPGDANLLDPQSSQHPRHAQVVGKWQIAVERALIAGAAIHALVVAAVGDRDPQIGDGAAEFVGKAGTCLVRWLVGIRPTGKVHRQRGNIPAAVSFPMASREAGRRRRFHRHPGAGNFFAKLAGGGGVCGQKLSNAKCAKEPQRTQRNHPSPPQPGYAHRLGRSETQLTDYLDARRMQTADEFTITACRRQRLLNRRLRQRRHDLEPGGVRDAVRRRPESP